MKKIIALFAILFFVVIATVLYQQYAASNSAGTNENTPKVTIKNRTFKLIIANSAKEKEIGLSSRRSLPQDYAMLFSFDKPGYYSFWMKNMQFPIDIIYTKDNKIVTIIENAQPAKSKDVVPQIYKPESPADTVIEINAGLSRKYNFKKGDKVKIEK